MTAWKTHDDEYNDEPDFKEFREEMESRFKNTPLICIVNMPSSNETNHYGPFQNGKEAMDWLGIQPMNVRFGFLPLRNPHIKRSADEFYFTPPDKFEMEYDHTPKEGNQ